MSVFSDYASSYLENGLSVMPCVPGDKFPGTYSEAGGWIPAYDWQKYGNERAPTGFELKIWDRWPDAGICAALGRIAGKNGLHLVAVDIDTDEPAEIAAIRSVLPGSPCAKRGAKGETQFYLAPPSVVSRCYNDANKRRMLDLLCEGRQTVMPPTLHPKTGQPYHWITPDALDSFDIADLPILPDDIGDRLAKALEPFGHVPDAPKVGARGDADLGIESPHRSLNDAALANLSAWIPDLSLFKCRQVGDKYKAVATWRGSSSGRPQSQRATNLAISREGIKDLGDNKGYTPIDLVMAATGCDLDVAFAWLQERVAPAPTIKLTARVKSEGNLSALKFKPTLVAVDGEIIAETDDAPTLAAEVAEISNSGTVIPAELCTPPGLLGDIVDWMNRSSPVPSPQLNLSAALALLGALYGRRYESPTGARTNFYSIGVADSGFGKSFPIKCLNAIEQAAGVSRFFGPSGLKSDSALRKLLQDKNPVLVTVDEVGELFSKILNRRAGSHEVGLRELLLALFSAADDVYRGSEGAAEKAQPIYQPHLALFGMSTPSAFWAAFSTANAENGLLPRILIFDAGANEPDEVTPELDRREVPQAVVKGIHAMLDARPSGNLSGLHGGSVSAIRAPYASGEAEALFVAIREEMKARRRKSDGLEKLAYSRFAEHCIKLALTYAIGCNPASPQITVAGLTWARQVVEYTTRTLIEGAQDRVADSEWQANYKKVLRIIKGAGAHGMAMDAMTRAIAGSIDKRTLADIVEQLVAAREIEKYIGSGPRGGRPGQRVRVMKREEEEAA